MPLVVALMACEPVERLGPGVERDRSELGEEGSGSLASEAGEQFGEESCPPPQPRPGGLHVLRGDEALRGEPGSSVVLGLSDCGQQIVGPGDVDGDGVSDVVVDCDEVALIYLSGATLLSGVATEIATLTVPAVTDDKAMFALGDLDGDGRGEVGVVPDWGPLAQNNPRDWGLVIPGGAVIGAVEASQVSWHVQAAGDWYPQIPTSPAGDFDGDGTPDVAVAAMPSSHPDLESRVYVVSGALFGATPWGVIVDATSSPLADLPGSRLLGPTRSAVRLGDVDGDGRSDLGVVQTGPASPSVRILLSGTPAALLDEAPEITVSAAMSEGYAEFVSLGDLDGDGLTDLAVALHAYESSEERWDGLAVVPGAAIPASGALSVTPFLLVEANVTEFEPCDLDGDGLPELVTSAGIWSGTDLLTPGAPPVAGGLERSLACLGDLDGDGTSELAWGDPSLE